MNTANPRAGAPRLRRALMNGLWRGPYRHPWRWLAGALLIALTAWSLPGAYASWLRLRWAPPESPARLEHSFQALVYDNSAGTAGNVTTAARFREHLEALHAAGYHPIGLDDVRDLMREGRPLPRQAVLITVDDCCERRGWHAWRMAAVQTRARAVFFVNPRDRRRPSWNVLRQTVATPHWEIGAAFPAFSRSGKPPKGDAEEALASDFDGARHYRRLHDVRRAAERAHHLFRTSMRRPFPRPVMALAYPARTPRMEAGNPDHDIFMHALADAATPAFELGFLKSGLALNSRRSDPLRLTRMRVSPDWRGRDLIARLRAESARPYHAGRRSETSAAWIPVFGEARIEDEALLLSAPPDGIAGLWLAGSDLLSAPLVAEIEFSRRAGVLRIPFLAARDESERWQIDFGADGAVTLAQLREGAPVRTFADRRAPSDGSADKLKLVVRPRLIQALLNNRILFGGGIVLDEAAAPGLLGLRVAGDGTADGESLITAARIEPQRPRLAVWPHPIEWDAQAAAWMMDLSAELTAISPPLERHERRAPQAAAALSERMFRTAARINHWYLYPHLSMQTPADLDHWTPERLAARMGEVDCDGLLVRFGETGQWRFADIAAWARQAARALHARGHGLLVRIPDMIADSFLVAGAIGGTPGVQWVFGPGHDDSGERSDGIVEVLAPAPSGSETDLRIFYDLLADGSGRVPDGERARVRAWRDGAEARFATGDYEAAVSLWFEWHETDPRHPLPLRRIGDTLYRLGYRDEAAEYYRQSLERDPGNFTLAIELANLLDAVNQSEGARDLLHVYGLLFPDETAIRLTQAEWLFRQGRHAESRAKIQGILVADPDNLSAALLMAQIAGTTAERQAAVATIVRLGRTPESRARVLQTVRNADLMTLPEAEDLLALLALPVPEGDLRLAEIVAELTPRPRGIVEAADSETLSDAWFLEGGTASIESDRIRVRAAAESEEVVLRLTGTERWRDVWLEAEVAEQTGEFWLVARRSRTHLVRFGFDAAADQLALQVWRRGADDFTLLTYRIEPWDRPSAGSVRLGLEVRGNGVSGYVDGRRLGRTMLALPAEISPAGSVAAVARALEPGQAAMTLNRIEAAPLFPAVAIPGEPVLIGNEMEARADALRRLLPHINAVSPHGFTIRPDGDWTGAVMGDDDFYRLFARFHGLRLLPRVRLEGAVYPRAAELRRAAELHNVDGFLVTVSAPPPPGLVDRWHRELSVDGPDVLLAVETADGFDMIACGPARFLLPGAAAGLPLRRLPAARAPVGPRDGGPVLFGF